jgi:hypothetical protein
MPNKPSTTKKILIGVSVFNLCLLLVLGFSIFITKKMASDIDQQRQSLVENIESTKKNLRLAQLISAIGPMKEQAKQYFVSSDNIVEFSEYLDKLAVGAHVEFSKTITRSADGLSVSLSFKGSFDDTRYFAGLIESLPYVLSVESVSFDGPGKKEFIGTATSTKESDRSKIGGPWSGNMVVNLKGSGQN